jgi:hypothetical protein
VNRSPLRAGDGAELVVAGRLNHVDGERRCTAQLRLGHLLAHERGSGVVVHLDHGTARQTEIARAGVSGVESVVLALSERLRVDERHPAVEAASGRLAHKRSVEAAARAEIGGGPVIAPAAAIVRLAIRDGEAGAGVDGVSEHARFALGLRRVGEALDTPREAGVADRAFEFRVAVLDDQRVEASEAGAAHDVNCERVV